MNCQKIDATESLKRSFFKVWNVWKMSNLAVLLRFANFLKSGLITFLYFLYTASWEWYWSTVKRWIFPLYLILFSSNEVLPNVLYHMASLLRNQSCPKIWKGMESLWRSFWRSERSNLDLFQLISQKRYIVLSKYIFVWNTYSKSYMAFQFNC